MPKPKAGAAWRRRWRWISWLVGAASLGAVVWVALSFSEQRDFVVLAARARPLWLLAAAVLQVVTFVAQAETWRVVTRAAKLRVTLATAARLSLVKHFVDQALPSAGISGTVLLAGALERRGVARSVVLAAVVVETASFYAAYVLALALALVLAATRGYTSTLVVVLAIVFGVFAATFGVAVVALSGRKSDAPRWLARVPVVGTAVTLLAQAERRLAQSPRLIAKSAVFQLVIIALDVATMWVVVRALGANASLSGVFASLMISSLLKTVSVVPGGLGAFEAVSVVTLRLAGVPVAVGLAATLLFRGLTFWLLLGPGLIFARREARGSATEPTAKRGHAAGQATAG